MRHLGDRALAFFMTSCLVWPSVGCGEETPTRPTAGSPVATELENSEVAPTARAPDEASADAHATATDDARPEEDPTPSDQAIAIATEALAPGPRARALCDKVRQCECESREGCEAGLAELERAAPSDTWACMMEQGCDALCAGEATAACLAEAGQAFADNLRAVRANRYCARHVQCGCPIAGCHERLAEITQPEAFAYASCATALACPAVCEEGGRQVAAGMVAHERCMAPILARMEPEERGGLDAIGALGVDSHRPDDGERPGE